MDGPFCYTMYSLHFDRLHAIQCIYSTINLTVWVNLHIFFYRTHPSINQMVIDSSSSQVCNLINSFRNMGLSVDWLMVGCCVISACGTALFQMWSPSWAYQLVLIKQVHFLPKVLNFLSAGSMYATESSVYMLLSNKNLTSTKSLDPLTTNFENEIN